MCQRVKYLEAYRNEQVVAAHKKTAHYLQCVEKLGPRKYPPFIGLMLQ